MRSDPYTQRPMEPARAGTDARDSRFDGLHAEAKAAVGYSANTLRSVRERYREVYSEALGEWQSLRDDLDADGRRLNDGAHSQSGTAPVDRAADAAEAGADDARRRTLRGDVETLTADRRTEDGPSRARRRWTAPPMRPRPAPTTRGGGSSAATSRP